MFYDLNVPLHVENQTTRGIVEKAMSLGYGCVALNHETQGQVSSSDFPKEINFMSEDVVAKREPLELFSTKDGSAPRFGYFSRITVKIDDLNHYASVNAANPVLQAYDIVAVKPSSMKMLAKVCSSPHVDLISLDLSSKPTFRLHRSQINEAMKKGIFFEIQYSGLWGDATTRRCCLSNSRTLCELTRGKNMIISSGAQVPGDIRSPYEVMHLAALLGLTKGNGKTIFSSNCELLLKKGAARKSLYKEAINICRVVRGGKEVSSHGKAVAAHGGLSVEDDSAVDRSKDMMETDDKVFNVPNQWVDS